jgi:hypothetical protein
MRQIDNDLDLMVVGNTTAAIATCLETLTRIREIPDCQNNQPMDYEAISRQAMEANRLSGLIHAYVTRRMAGRI